MQPAIIYKLGTRLKIELHYEPEPCFKIYTHESVPAVLNLGDMFDLIRFLTMFSSKQQIMLGKLSGKPVALTGKKTLECLYTDNPLPVDQLSLFPEEEVAVEPEPEVGSSDPVREAARKRRLELVTRLQKNPDQRDLISELAYIDWLLRQ